MKRLLSLFLLISVSPLMAINSETFTWAKNIEFKRGVEAVTNDVTNVAKAAYQALPSQETVLNTCKDTAKTLVTASVIVVLFTISGSPFMSLTNNK